MSFTKHCILDIICQVNQLINELYTNTNALDHNHRFWEAGIISSFWSFPGETARRVLWDCLQQKGVGNDFPTVLTYSTFGQTLWPLLS